MMKLRVIILFLWVMDAAGCKKSTFLDANPNNSLLVPTTIQQLQELLDNDLVMNGYGQSGSPNLVEMGAGDYWVPDAILTTYFSTYYQEACVWAAVISSGSNEVIDWDLPYRRVFYANEVLTGLGKIVPTAATLQVWQTAQGGAYFFRATSFFELAQVFAPAYDSLTADTTWGIPLRLTDETTEKITRATVRETYQRIAGDLRLAASVLGDGETPFPTRPSKTAAFGMLARVYLAMGKYDSAYAYSDSCLARQSALMQYDTVDESGLGAFNRFNVEVIFAEVMEQINVSPVSSYTVFVDSALYASYSDSDVRKTLYFYNTGGGVYFLGSYDQEGDAFSGLATDEQYLIRAECAARAGKVNAAMTDLNALLQTRWLTGTYASLSAVDVKDALGKILTERRKELCFRGLRWSDLRRLYKDPWWPTQALYRGIGGTVYQLPPGSPRYVYPIPDNVMGFNPGMPQNTR
jgi:hypothetical protein